MPRRVSNHSAAVNSAPELSTLSSTLPQSLPENLIVLRKQWKWAAFSQFFFTFSPLFAMDDVSLKDVEDDLYMGSSLVLPRIMVRLLYTLSYDRKVNLNNWQTTLRRQYNKREPAANPIGPEPIREDDYARGTTSPDPYSTKESSNEPGDNTGVLDESPVQGQSMSVQKDKAYDAKSGDDSVVPNDREKAKDPSPDYIPEEESKDWLSLPMLEKLDSLHLLTEWQFQSPARVRTLMKSDDDQASWRIEPIGYDAKRNAYWLIGADRLWIQRVPPKPPRPPPKSSLKRKRAADTNQAQAKPSSPKRSRLQAAAKNRKTVAKPTAEPIASTNGRHGRAAKDQANLKLDAQAKELAELNRQAALLAGHSSKSSARGAASSKAVSSPARATRSTTSARPLGTRLSARLRGSEDDEWQAIPDEWLQDNDDDDVKGKGKGKHRSPVFRRSVSSISDLTELSEESEKQGSPAEELQIAEETQPVAPVKFQVHDSNARDFVEWETIAVTLHEWEHIAELWQNATHYSEKALYKVLKNHIVPIITEELKEVEVKRQKEEAITQRKRSSRIAIRESEKEEARLAAKKKAEEEEKMSRAKRLEARQQKEEAERMKRETARELRRKEREAKEEREAREAEEKEKKEREKAERTTGRTKQRSSQFKGAIQPLVSDNVLLLHPPGGSNYSSINGSTRGSRSSYTPAGDDWELDCEICNRRGVNPDERVPLMSCALCSRWQHISCHDQADLQAGRPQRNWDQVEFICRKCQMNARDGSRNSVQMQYPQAMSMHSSLHPSASSPYNQVPYGQGLGFDSGAISNGYAEVPTANGTKGYGTSEIRSPVASRAHMDYVNARQNPKQISFSHYQPQQHNFLRNGSEQRRFHNSSNGYGHPTPAHSYENYGNPQNEHTRWNGASADYSHENPLTSSSTSTYMPHSAERFSIIPESSSRHIPHDEAAYYQQQQQQWNPRPNSSERLSSVSESSLPHNQHDLPTHYQQQQWRPLHPTAASPQTLSRTDMTSSSPLQPRHL